jgi:enoyl-[acyl-carrier-protein] reductase (NADH)
VKRLLEAEEIAAMATLLASGPGSAITGQCISVDGGIVLSG